MDRKVNTHALHRAAQRYGKILKADDLDRMTGIIILDKSRFVSRLSKSRTIRIVHYRGCDYKVIWNRNQKRIMTILPPDFVQPKLGDIFDKKLLIPAKPSFWRTLGSFLEGFWKMLGKTRLGPS